MSVADRVALADKQKRHKELCDAVRKDLPAFLSVGNNLIEIKELGVYLDTHKSFEEFVRETFNIEKSQTYRLMEAAQVSKKLLDEKVEVPVNESQLREVAKAPPEKQAEVVKKAVEKAAEENRKPVAKDFAEAVKQVTGELLLEDEVPIDKEEEVEIEDEPTIAEICDESNKAIESFCRSMVKQFEKEVPRLPWTEDSGRIDSALASLRAGLTTLRGAKSEVCPACVEGMTESNGSCRYCKGHGYLPAYQATTIPEDERL
jgi:hypothetical protein